MMIQLVAPGHGTLLPLRKETDPSTQQHDRTDTGCDPAFPAVLGELLADRPCNTAAAAVSHAGITGLHCLATAVNGGFTDGVDSECDKRHAEDQHQQRLPALHRASIPGD